MSQVIAFCGQTISEVNGEIKKTKTELLSDFNRNKRGVIISTLERNDKLDRKHILLGKTKKLYQRSFIKIQKQFQDLVIRFDPNGNIFNILKQSLSTGHYDLLNKNSNFCSISGQDLKFQ